ncbi:MAG: hypothetical protein WED81_07100, partial [Rhodothermales bacterium]
QTLRELAALRFVEFSIDGLTDARLAGVQIQRLRSHRDLSAADVARIARAVASRKLPLQFRLHVGARNPEENGVQARLLRMDWTLLLEDRETIHGVLEENFVIPPGAVTDIPLNIELDLVDFFDRNLEDLVDLALSIAGGEGEATNVKLRARPTVDTPIGPIEYPQPITIVSRDFGGEGAAPSQ